MPNAAARRTRKAQTDTPVAAAPEIENGEFTVTSTVQVGRFAVEELDGYEFTRPGAGRKRTPTEFDDAVNEWVGTTRRLAVADKDEYDVVVKELQKACDYRNRGLQKRPEEMDGQLYVVFRVEAEKAKRVRKAKDESESISDADRVEAAETE